MFCKTYTFGTNKEINAQTFYRPGSGFGFVDQENIPGETMSEKSLHNGGWNLRKNSMDDWKQAYETIDTGVRIAKDRFVLIFKAEVPDFGTYRITMTYQAASGQNISGMRLYAGRRNLIERDIVIEDGQTYQCSFYIHVTPYIPAMTAVPNNEKAIYLSVCGIHAGISELTIEEADAPTLFIAGDSTLTDQNALFPYYPYGSCGGWAQVLSQYFHSNSKFNFDSNINSMFHLKSNFNSDSNSDFHPIAVCNQAHSGLTTNCFRDDGHWQIVKDHIKKGDIFFLQFGHNDQKRRNLAAFGGYIDNLRWYVHEIRSIGAFPVILSPISRKPFEDNGKMRSLLSLHALACKTAAEECDVPFIDLHTLTFDFWCKLGENAKDYFMKGDITHTNDYGACAIAQFVAAEILRQKIEPLCSCMGNQMISLKPPFTPDSDTKEVPAEPGGGMFEISLPYLDVTDETQKKQMTEALRKGLLDPCVMHLHPDETMPRAQFLMPFFKALRLSGKRPYLGKFCDLSRYEWDSSYVEACISQDLIDPETVPDDRFRPDDSLTVREFASFVIRSGEPEASKRSSLTLEECLKKAKALSLIPSGKQPADLMTRAECYHGLVLLMGLLDNADKALPSDTEIHPVG